jgi:hypothetical protein
VGCINSIVLVGAGVLGLIEPVMSLALSTRRRGPVLASLLYVMSGRLTALVLLCFRSSECRKAGGCSLPSTGSIALLAVTGRLLSGGL